MLVRIGVLALLLRHIASGVAHLLLQLPVGHPSGIVGRIGVRALRQPHASSQYPRPEWCALRQARRKNARSRDTETRPRLRMQVHFADAGICRSHGNDNEGTASIGPP